MVEVVVPFNPDSGRREMVAILNDQNADQAGLTANPLRVSGELVAVPFRKGMYNPGASGAGSAPSVGGGFPENDDGTQTGIFVSVPASATWANVATLGHWFMGRVYGTRLLRDASYGGKSVGLTIDGVAYEVETAILVTPAGQSTSNTNPGLGGQMIADDLTDGWHYAEYTFPCATSGSRAWGLLGFIAEARYYPRVTPGVNFSYQASNTLTASWTALAPSNNNCYGYRGVIFYNPTGGAVVAQVRYNSSNGVCWGQSVPAGGSVTFDPLGIINHSFEVTGDGLKAMPIGAHR